MVKDGGRMRIIDGLYERYLMKRYRKENAKKHVVFAGTAKFSRNCFFEGNNFVAGELYGCRLGYGTYVHNGSVLRNVKLGRFCGIGENVNIRLFEHPIHMVSISPCFYRKEHKLKTYVNQDLFDDLKIVGEAYSVEIGNDVWIGSNVLIKSGITIGDGAVVAAGAVVTGDVEPYAIVGGVPAKRIRYRFTREQIEALLRIKWWEWDESWFAENGMYFADVDNFIEMFDQKDHVAKSDWIDRGEM